jgi:FkbM family methyltransferase
MKYTRKINKSRDLIVDCLVYCLSRRLFRKVSNLFLDIILKSNGFNNCCSNFRTGESYVVKFIKESSPRICLDIGANKGFYSESILSNTNAIVYAFEPNPNIFHILNNSLKKYGDRFKAFNIALGSIRKNQNLYFGSDTSDKFYSEYGTLSESAMDIDYCKDNNTNQVSVEVNTLDNLLHEYPILRKVDFIKIDTEGFEHDVIEGAKDFIKTVKPKFIQIEYNLHQLYRGHSMKLIAQNLVDYSLYRLLPFNGGLKKQVPESGESNIYMFSNYIFIRNDLVDEYQSWL